MTLDAPKKTQVLNAKIMNSHQKGQTLARTSYMEAPYWRRVRPRGIRAPHLAERKRSRAAVQRQTTPFPLCLLLRRRNSPYTVAAPPARRVAGISRNLRSDKEIALHFITKFHFGLRFLLYRLGSSEPPSQPGGHQPPPFLPHPICFCFCSTVGCKPPITFFCLASVVAF